MVYVRIEIEYKKGRDELELNQGEYLTRVNSVTKNKLTTVTTLNNTTKISYQ